MQALVACVAQNAGIQYWAGTTQYGLVRVVVGQYTIPTTKWHTFKRVYWLVLAGTSQ